MIGLFKKIFTAVALCFALSLPTHGAAPDSTLPILMYHHIHSSPGNQSDYTILPDTLKGDLAYLQDKGYSTVSLSQLLAYSRGEATLPEKSVMITFDDGQASFAAYAQPLFEAYGMCAVLSIVGRYADIYTETEDHNISYCYFSWPELAALETSPCVELAGHTYNMHSLQPRKGCLKLPSEDTAEYDAALSQDLTQLEQRFSDYIGTKPEAFAYPYGFYCKETKSFLEQHGYRVIFTCEERVNQLTGDPQELLHLGRFNRPSSADRVSFFNRLGIV